MEPVTNGNGPNGGLAHGGGFSCGDGARGPGPGGGVAQGDAGGAHRSDDSQSRTTVIYQDGTPLLGTGSRRDNHFIFSSYFDTIK